MAVDRVTSKEQGLLNVYGEAIWASGQRGPYTHQASFDKQRGRLLLCSWDCANSGDAAGIANLVLYEGTTVLRTEAGVSIPADTTVTMTAIYTLPRTTSLGGHTYTVKMFQGTSELGTHSAPVNIIEYVPTATLAPSGNPTFS